MMCLCMHCCSAGCVVVRCVVVFRMYECCCVIWLVLTCACYVVVLRCTVVQCVCSWVTLRCYVMWCCGVLLCVVRIYAVIYCYIMLYDGVYYRVSTYVVIVITMCRYAFIGAAVIGISLLWSLLCFVCCIVLLCIGVRWWHRCYAMLLYAIQYHVLLCGVACYMMRCVSSLWCCVILCVAA